GKYHMISVFFLTLHPLMSRFSALSRPLIELDISRILCTHEFSDTLLYRSAYTLTTSLPLFRHSIQTVPDLLIRHCQIRHHDRPESCPERGKHPVGRILHRHTVFRFFTQDPARMKIYIRHRLSMLHVRRTDHTVKAVIQTRLR